LASSAVAFFSHFFSVCPHAADLARDSEGCSSARAVFVVILHHAEAHVGGLSEKTYSPASSQKL
jgi:hypothetical protein